MAEMIGVAEAKRRFGELINRVQAGERFVITRRGRAVMAFVPADDAEREREEGPYLGLISLVGVMEDWPEFGEVMDEVYASRQHQLDRDVPYFNDLD